VPQADPEAIDTALWTSGGPALTAEPRPSESGGRPAALGRVLVTGGASGLGAAVVAAVAKAGGTPIVLDLDAPEGEVDHEQVDLSDARAAEAAVRRAIERHGGLDAIVTAAGTDACGTIDAVSGEAWDRVIAVNLIGTAAVVRAALPALEQAENGRVVTVASSLGLRVLSDATAYCASKFGVVGFTRALALETKGRIGVTMLVPSGMRTHFFDGREPQYKPGPDAPLMDPADVADTVVFALGRPKGVEVRELLVCSAEEPSWP
jgi:NAD(P)-dependent dehydrogenase (short-subunit alcohol dehydrogenase family)